MTIFIIFFLPLFYYSIYREKRIVKRDLKDKPWKEDFSLFSEVLPFKYELYRKLTHLVVLGIVFFYFTLGFLVQNIFVYVLEFFPDIVSEIFFSIYNIEANKMIFTQYLVVFLVGVSLIGMLSADFIRILRPDIYPLKPVNRILRKKAMTMSIFADMTANLVGKKFGRKKIRNTKKTYEGLFAGMIVAFVSGVITLLLLRQIYMLKPVSLILIPFIGAIIIGLIDFLDLEVDDNLSYNFTVSTILFFISILILI
jgi:dolichol kinase